MNDLKAAGIFKEVMSQLNLEEQKITMTLFSVGKMVRVEALVTGNKNWYMENVKYAIKKMRTNGSTWHPTWNQVRKTIQKLERIGLMRIDEDGLPLWFYKELDEMSQA